MQCSAEGCVYVYVSIFLCECQVDHLTANPLAPALDLKQVASEKLAELQLAEGNSDNDS